jgi:hypothetical protein
MKLEEANYFIVGKNLTFYISLENKKKQNVETFDINFINKIRQLLYFCLNKTTIMKKFNTIRICSGLLMCN